MAYFVPVLVAFDDGPTVEIQNSSRDMLALEKAGIKVGELGSMEAGYVMAHTALLRLARTDRLPEGVEVPETWEGLADVADLIPTEDGDPEGKGSGQGPSTGE